MMKPPDLTDKEWKKCPIAVRAWLREYRKLYASGCIPALPPATPVPLAQVHSRGQSRMNYFALVSTPRSGTHMLRTALNSHPEIVVSEELFNPPHAPGNALLAHREYASWRVEAWQSGKRIAGSVLHREPWRADRNWEEWRYAKVLHSRFVCLHRENKLRQFLSRKNAVVLRNWGSDKPRKATPPPLRVSPKDLLMFIEESEILRQFVDGHFSNRLCTTYERLLANWENEIAAILDYLGAAPAPIAPLTVRQENRPLRQAIANYDEIAAALRSWEFERWLDS